MNTAISVIFLMLLAPHVAHAEDRQAKLAATLRPNIPPGWRIAYEPERTAYSATSPIYAIEHDQGCVMHRQIYPVIEGKISFARMEFYSLYFATAGGGECFAIPPNRFFAVEEGTEPYGTLDFIRELFRGPATDRSHVDSIDAPRLAECFAATARERVQVIHASTRPAPDSPDLIYTVTMSCSSLRPEERIVASGIGDRKIAWDIRPAEPIDVGDRAKR